MQASKLAKAAMLACPVVPVQHFTVYHGIALYMQRSMYVSEPLLDLLCDIYLLDLHRHMHAVLRHLKAEVEEGKQGLQAAVDKSRQWRRSTEEHQAVAEQSASQISQLQVCPQSGVTGVSIALHTDCAQGNDAVIQAAGGSS